MLLKDLRLFFFSESEKQVEEGQASKIGSIVALRTQVIVLLVSIRVANIKTNFFLLDSRVCQFAGVAKEPWCVFF